VDPTDAAAARESDNRTDKAKRELEMTHLERWLPFHLFVVTFVAVAVAAALIVDGLGLAVVVGLALVIILASGYPLLVILAEERDQPVTRKRR
jgi:hypothetical protein